MAKNPKSGGAGNSGDMHDEPVLIPDDEHPDFIGGTIAEGDGSDGIDEDLQGFDDGDGLDELSHVPGGPTIPPRVPPRIPGRPTIPLPRPFPPLRFCGLVSGKYRYRPPVFVPRPISPGGPSIPRPIPGPIIPINLLQIKVRVDVDRYFPQERISIEVNRLWPRASAHAIAEVTSDRCMGLNNRIIDANIVYRDGTNSLIPGTRVRFHAERTTGFGYGKYTLTLSGGGITPKKYNLAFESRYFDPVEFEVDRVANSGGIVTAYNTADHPRRPANLPNEVLSLATVFQRAGFDAKMSPNGSVIPTSGAGANGTWSDTEMHNAMVTYWSRFANNPKWAMWVLYAARHDRGRGLGGIMFDDIGPNHRQGTAIFTDSFIQDVPGGDPDPAGYRRRNQFWTAVHEMGHGFNLAHSWQKALGAPYGNPWIPLANEPEARSFMNYPRRVSGGENAFWNDFRFRFSDDELIFMRHAPRRFVQMGNDDWFENHGFEAPSALEQTGDWTLEVRPNRDNNSYRFLEPVSMELKLTNSGDKSAMMDGDMLQDGRHITVFVQREGGETKQWRPMITRCHEDHDDKIDVGESIYGSHVISTSTDGWLIDEAGFYKVQAAIDLGDQIVTSNVLRLYVSPPKADAEAAVAPDYFTEDVARVVAFNGAPELSGAEDVLRTVAKTCGDNPAARHAEVALTNPGLRNFKVLDAGSGRDDMKIKTQAAKVTSSAKAQTKALLDDPDGAADTLGHISFFGQLRSVAEALEEDGDDKGAIQLMKKTIKVMKDRKILQRVIDNAEARLERRS